MTKFLKVMAFSLLVCTASASVSSNVYADKSPSKTRDLELLLPLNPPGPAGPPFNNNAHEECHDQCHNAFRLCWGAGDCIVDDLLPLFPNPPVCNASTVLDSCMNFLSLCIRECDREFG